MSKYELKRIIKEELKAYVLVNYQIVSAIDRAIEVYAKRYPQTFKLEYDGSLNHLEPPDLSSLDSDNKWRIENTKCPKCEAPYPVYKPSSTSWDCAFCGYSRSVRKSSQYQSLRRKEDKQ